MDPLLNDVPERLDTARLILRVPQAGDGLALWSAIRDSMVELREWMAWANDEASLETGEVFARGAHAQFHARQDLVFYGFARLDDGSEGPLLVASGLHRVDWKLGRFEIGYWRRSGFGGQGLVDEVVQALTALAFERLNAQRVEIRMDALNRRSWRVAERCGFTLEGTLRRDSLTPQGQPRDTRVYAKVRGVEWVPPASAPAPAPVSPLSGGDGG